MIVPFRQRNPTFWIGDEVVLRMCDDADWGLITAVSFKDNSEVYEVTWGNGLATYHHDFELASEFTPRFPKNGDE